MRTEFVKIPRLLTSLAQNEEQLSCITDGKHHVTGSVASLYQVVFRCGAVSGRVVLTASGRGHIFAAVVMKYFSRWVIHKGTRRKQNWVRSKNSHRIQLHCKTK